MIGSLKTAFLLGAIATVASVVCPLCGNGPAPAAAAVVAPSAQVPDTAQLRLHISGMTCGSCPLTARMALRRVPGVYSAVVTLDDSLGVVRFDARKVTGAQITAQLTRLTGFRARVLTADGAPRPGPS